MIEWRSMHDGALFGAIAGGSMGLVGGSIGVLTARGKLRGPVLGSMKILLAAGAGALVLGLFALIRGQPYHVWYPLLLCGVILTLIMGVLLPVITLRYRQAEARRMDAEAIRRS